MTLDLQLLGGLVLALALLASIDVLLARALGVRLDRAVLAMGVILPVLLLAPWFDRGTVLSPTNFLQGTIPGAPAHEVSRAHDHLNDAVYQFLPWELEIRHAFRDRHLPLWSDLLEGGSSPWLNPQAGVLSPLAWLARPFEIQHFLLALLALKLMHALLGTWVVCRRLGVRRRIALVCASGFVLCGAMMSWALFPHTTALSWLPWLIAGVVGLFRARRWWRIAPVAIVTGGLLLSGHPEVAAGGGILSAVAGIALRSRRESLARSLGVAGLAALLGFGLAAPLLVPFAARLPQSQRAQETLSESVPDDAWKLAEPASWLTPGWSALLRSPLNPHVFGRPYEGPFSGHINWVESTTGYAGIVALLGGCVALAGESRRRALPFLGFFVVSLLLAAHVRPVLHAVETIRPLRALAFERLLLPGGLALWIAAGLGLESMLRREARRWIPTAVATLAALVVLQSKTDPGVLGLTLLAIAGVVLSLRWQNAGVALLAAATLLDLVPWSRAHLPQGDASLFYPRTAFMQGVAREVETGGIWRAVGEDWAVFPSLLPVYGVAEARPHNPLVPMPQIDALDAAFGFAPTRLTYFPPFRNAGHPLIDFLNVRIVVWNSPNLVPERFVRVESAKDAAFRLYRNPDALPRWFFPTRIDGVERAKLTQWIEALGDGRHVAVPPEAANVPLASGSDRLAPHTLFAGTVTLRTETSSGALVATSLPAPEGWSARTSSGERLQRVVVNGAFFGFVVPAGAQEVTMRFAPPGFAGGVAAGIAAALGCAWLLWRDRRRLRLRG